MVPIPVQPFKLTMSELGLFPSVLLPVTVKLPDKVVLASVVKLPTALVTLVLAVTVVNVAAPGVVPPIVPGEASANVMSLIPEMLSTVASVLLLLSLMITFRETPPVTQMLVVRRPEESKTIGLEFNTVPVESV